MTSVTSSNFESHRDGCQGKGDLGDRERGGGSCCPQGTPPSKHVAPRAAWHPDGLGQRLLGPPPAPSPGQLGLGLCRPGLGGSGAPRCLGISVRCFGLGSAGCSRAPALRGVCSRPTWSSPPSARSKAWLGLWPGSASCLGRSCREPGTRRRCAAGSPGGRIRSLVWQVLVGRCEPAGGRQVAGMQGPVGPGLEAGRGHISPSTNATQALSSSTRGQGMCKGLGRSCLRNEKLGLVGLTPPAGPG